MQQDNVIKENEIDKSNKEPIKLFVSALEPSANLHLKNVLKHMHNVELYGVCSKDIAPSIKSNLLYDMQDFSIMGILEVLKRYSFLKKALKDLSKQAIKCEKILLMDSSSFNIRLAKLIKKANKNCEIIYYILPQVWVWKAWRAKVIQDLCNHLICILPFETSFYDECKKIEYLGHPLLDIYTDLDVLEINETSHIFTFMPGSRANEILALMKEFQKVATSLKQKFEDARFRIVIPDHIKDKSKINKLYGDLNNFEIFYDLKKALKECNYAFVCAGTASLEVNLLGIPLCVCYIAKKLDYFLLSKFITLKVVGLGNIIFQALNNQPPGRGESLIHQEFIQENCYAENLVKSYLEFDFKSYRQNIKGLRAYLKQGSSKEVAKILQNK